MSRHLQIGDAVPVTPPAAIVGPPIPPVWHILVAMPQAEAKLRAWLADRDVEAWFPQVERKYANRFNPAQPTIRVVPAVTGYVLARFEAAPRWHIICDCRYVARYVSQDGRPVVVSDAELSRMEDVPDVLARYRAEEIARKMADEARAARERAKYAPIVGQPARIEAGIMAGRVGRVEALDPSGKWADVAMENITVTILAANVRRIDEADAG